MGGVVLYALSFVMQNPAIFKGQLGGEFSRLIVQFSSLLPASGEKETDILLSGDSPAARGEKEVRFLRLYLYASPQKDLALRSFILTRGAGRKESRDEDVKNISVYSDNVLLGTSAFANGKAVFQFSKPVKLTKNSVMMLEIRVGIAPGAQSGDTLTLGFASKNDLDVVFADSQKPVSNIEKFLCIKGFSCNLTSTERDIELLIQ